MMPVPVQQPPQVLQGKATKQVFAGHDTFQSIIDLNPDYDQWSQSEKDEIAGEFFKEKYRSYEQEPDYQGLRTAFNQKYNVGGVPQARDFNKLPFFSPVPGQKDQLSQYIDAAALYTGSVVDPAHDLLNPFDRNATQRQEATARTAYPGIETDPGFLGNAYRAHQNRYANMAGQAIGAFGTIRNIATRLPEQALSKFPLLSKLPAAAQNAIASTGLFSGATNAADVIHGKQNIPQAVGNTALDVATAPLGGASRLKNTAIQGASGGASGYLSSLIGDATSGRTLDFEAAKRAALEQAAIGAGMGYGLHGGAPQTQQRTIRGRALRESPPVDRGPRGVTPRA